MFELGRLSLGLCVVIYQLPKYNKDFIDEFSDFLTGLVPNYDSILIVGDLDPPVWRLLLRSVKMFLLILLKR